MAFANTEEMKVIADKQMYDVDSLKELLKIILPNVKQEDIKCFRIGIIMIDNIHPVKVILSSCSDAMLVLSSFSKDLLENSSFSTTNASLSNDRTPKEKKCFDNLKCELRETSAKGDQNLTIKPKNGFTVILKSNPKKR